jgi:hypothetical protein
MIVIDYDLNKTRLCADIALACLLDNQAERDAANVRLKKELGNGWSETSAFQFLAGKTAKAALDKTSIEEQRRLLIAYQFAKMLNDVGGLCAASKLNEQDKAELIALLSSAH